MAWLWFAPSVIVVALVILGPLLPHLEWVQPDAGFRLFLVGGLLAALSAGVCGGAALLAAALGWGWRRHALRGAILPLVVFLVGVVPNLNRPHWPSNDVTTDLQDPPGFVSGPAAGAPYPDQFADAQRQHFPDIAPIRLPVAPAEALQRAERIARSMPDWEVVSVDASRGLLQAVAVSRIFRFRDDLIVRIRADARGSRIDVRSRSRVGRSDLGTNAIRIRALREALLEGADG